VLHNNLQLQWFLPMLIVCQKVYMFFQHLFDHTPLWCHCIHSEHPVNSSSNSKHSSWSITIWNIPRCCLGLHKIQTQQRARRKIK
jgi:hypothetical protein